jgi:hypothetical protein
MPNGSLFLYPRDDDEYDFNYDFGLTWDSWYGKLLSFMIQTIKKILELLMLLIITIYSFFGYYIMWIVLQYAAAHLYPVYCMPISISGFLLSPFMVSAPHCVAMRWMITEGSNIIITMWVTLGAYAIQRMIRG